MKPLARIVAIGTVLTLALSGASAAPKLVNSWAAPELAPVPGQKWLVLAQVTEEAIKRSLEDAAVAELKKRKVDAIPAYSHLTPADLESGETIRAKAKELGVNAGLVFKSVGVDTKAAPTPTVSVGVGVGGYGGFGGFLGVSKPMGGGTKLVHTAKVRIEYYKGEVEGQQWIGDYSVQIGDDVMRDTKDLAYAAVKQLRKVKGIE